MAVTRVLDHFIDGEYRSGSADSTIDLIDPTTGGTFARAPVAGVEEVESAYAAADRAFAVWRQTAPAERQRVLLAIADDVERRAGEFAAVESENTGKPLHLMLAEEIPPLLDNLRFFAGAARVLEGRAAGEYLPGHTSWIRREPVGVIGQVTPWNYPLMMAVWKIAPALAAGNSVVLKPSDTTPSSTLLLAEIAARHLPPGALNVVCGDRATGELVVGHRRADMVAITGSVRAGMAVAASAAADLKRVHLELGGKAPVVVFADADLHAVADAVAVAGYFNAGQDCTAATRILVDDTAHDELVALLVDRVGALRTTYDGGPADVDAFVPPVNNARQLASVTGFLERLPRHAEVPVGGGRLGDRGFFVEPTLVTGLQQDDEIVQREVFGPVVSVQRFRDEEEAVRFANGVDYALASSVWTRDHARAMRLSRSLDFGCVWINTHMPLVSEMPHGGFKHSGYGKDLSLYGFDDYTRIKHVMSCLDA